ncbi:MAG: mandelate racemase [Gemmatimonadetes bacterium]|jgi:L-alanine-DL-glutamate epimerase-like enolase superfamily enzyme|nr:mandelate racemase [Gemmatimonadota bacterium]MBT5327284.1 mandelate racemase [Gemmatimonadota bacterium]MBT6619176.1 mandelate racemase [Gemmatimonadota bacterium]MBT6903191.1 mandelate racemase [Gemmatimonadota bacterium]MBT7418975.1 mandelate racemase [Gemmatimonadota bacterium]
MKIKEIKCRVLKVPRSSYRWRDGFPRAPAERDAFLLQVTAENGVEGYCIGARLGEVIGRQTERLLKPQMLGENALDREKIWQRLWDMGRMGTEIVAALSAFDVALWDLAAKSAGVPLYKHLGAYRDKVPAYASTFTQETVEDYEPLARDCVARGYKAIKLHVFGDVKKDIEACRLVRETVGDDIELMLDASAAYNFEEALWAGRELEKLNFYWFEEPMRDYEMTSLQELHRRLEINLCVAETSWDSLFDVANHIAQKTGRMMHATWYRKGGITGLLKIAHTCEAFGMMVQLHHGEIPMIHAGCAIKNNKYVEILVPEEGAHLCLATPPIVPDEEGCVRPPEGPGLGYELNWDEIEACTVGEV